MKRSPLRRKTPLSRGNKPLQRRTPLRVVGQSTATQLKGEIQMYLRLIVMARDKGCILRTERGCGNEIGMPGVVFQADHLISRANSATFANPDLVVCVCRGCHAWKSLGNNLRKAQYDAMLKLILPESRVKLWEKCEADSWRPSKMDWALELVALKQIYSKMTGANLS